MVIIWERPKIRPSRRSRKAAPHWSRWWKNGPGLSQSPKSRTLLSTQEEFMKVFKEFFFKFHPKLIFNTIRTFKFSYRPSSSWKTQTKWSIRCERSQKSSTERPHPGDSTSRTILRSGTQFLTWLESKFINLEVVHQKDCIPFPIQNDFSFEEKRLSL